MQIQLFHFNNSELRTITRDGEPWFVAVDVCKILEISNITQAVSRLDSDEVALISNEGVAMNFVNESGLYSLVLGSRKPESRAFKRWITHEVLPSIRKTGSYSVGPKLPGTYIEALEQLVVTEKEKLLLAQQNAEMAPKAAYFDTVAASKDMVPIGTAAKTLRLPYGRTTLFAKLRADKILMANNEPYQEYVNRGYFVVREGTRIGSDGRSHITHTTKVTGKGMDFLRRRYCPDDGQLALE